MASPLLPTKVREPIRSDPKFLIVYGKPKVGKTSIAAELPDNLIIDLERGAEFISALTVPAYDYNELTSIWLALRTEKVKTGKNPYRYLTLDSATKLEEWAEEVATADYKKLPIAKTQQELKSILDLPNGAGYGLLRKTFMRIVLKFLQVSDHIILIGHVANSKINKEGELTSARDLNLTGRLKDIAAAECDAIGYMYRDIAGRTMISFQPVDQDEVMGSRAVHLVNKKMEFKWKDIYLDDRTLNPTTSPSSTLTTQVV